MDARLRLLVLGDDGAGKHALVTALCGDAAVRAPHEPPVRIAVRNTTPHRCEEYTVLGGSARLALARDAVARRGYDGVVLAHACPDSRASVRRVWAPLAMRHLGDAGSVHAAAAGRRRHVRALGVRNELRVLWRDTVARRLPLVAAAAEACRLAWCGARLLAHEAGVWTMEHVDAEAERELLAGTEVPVAVLRWDEADARTYSTSREDEQYAAKLNRSPAAREARVLFNVHTGAYENPDDNAEWAAFLHRCDVAARDVKKLGQRRIRSRKSFSSIAGALPF